MDQEEQSSWQYKPDGGPEPRSNRDSLGKRPAMKSRAEPISWEATEYIEHPHGPGWYGALVLCTGVLAAAGYFAAKDIMAGVIIGLAGVALGIFAAQKPKRVKYEILPAGLSIDGKLFSFSSYKSFAVVREGELMSINLFPLRRFMPPLSAYFEPKDDEMIIDALGNYLPYEDRKLDGIERIARRLRL